MASYFIRPNKSKSSWRLLEEIWKDGKKLSQLTVPKSAYEALGFSISMTIEQARLRVKQINAIKTIDKKKIVAAARRIEFDTVLESVYLPKNEALEFAEKLKKATFTNNIYENRILSHWKFVQKLISDIKIEPREYHRNSEIFYKYFIEKKISLDYSRKLLRIVNMWGNFICYKYGQFYSNISNPKGRIKEIVNDSYIDSENYRGESNPLNNELLFQKKDLLKSNGNFEWLFISIWFGLRPMEIDSLKDSKKYRIEHGKQKVLWVYQSKLTSVSRDKRWKGIPILYSEQEEALLFIESRNFKRPIYKAMRNAFGENITLYGGRKNFEDMMLDKGHRLEDISMWMGHQNIQTTWGKYRNRKRVGGSKID